MKNTKIIKQITVAIALICLAVGWRVINYNFHIAPNLEIVTTASVLAAIILGLRAGIIVPLATMILSDLVIGNSSIFIFTWSAFVIIGLSASLLRKFNKKPISQIVYSFGFAIAGSFTFFVVTNFGVWAQGWYPATWAGLADCFIMAIPFYRTMLIGNIILVPTAVGAWQLVRIRMASKDLVVDSLVR